jgi:ketosteroid isomerase-like protein
MRHDRRTMPATLDDARAANVAFYAAFEKLDAEAMARVWSRQAPLLCIHPGWEPLLGAAEVMASWAAIFRNTSYMEIEFEELAADGDDRVAWFHGTELVRQAGEAGQARGQVLATNIFRREAGGWRMVAHHASPMPR